MPVSLQEQAAIRAEVRQALLKFGYDVDNPKDTAIIQENHRWIAQQRENQRSRAANRVNFIWSALAAISGAIATIIGDWMVRRSSGGH